jgi:DNA-binding winged helix-turn-helix (wHTH) protein/Tol biopolymer transport system component
MAPEQFEGKEVNPATDIYAMGVVLYEMLTGKRPFAAPTSLGTAILRARRLEPASSIQNGVPHQWDLVIAKCLEYDPKLRFQSANELAEALQGSKSCVFRFGDVEVRESEFRLCRAGKVLPVEPKAFRVLLFLLRNPGKLIGKKELLNAVWGDTIVTDKSLARRVALLRRLLSDDARDPRYIETVSTVGYRFVCSVEMLGDTSLKPDTQVQSNTVSQHDSASGPSAGAASSQETASGKAGFRKRAILGTATVISLIAFAILYLRLPLPPPRISEYFQVTRDGERKSPIGTDGNRLYLNLLYPQGIGQVSISGGQIAQIPIDSPNGEVPHVWLRDVSPDGSSLLVWNPLEGLFVAGIFGHPVRHLANGLQAAWSPDGKWVAYSTDHGEIYLIRSKGGEPHLLVSSSSPVPEYKIITDLSWSPDGGSIRFTRDQALWQVTSTGSNLHLLLPKWNPSSWKCCGVWTPDGKLFLFVSGELNSSPFLPGAQLWAIEERSGQSPDAEPIQLTFGPIRWGKPIPARDGRRIFARGVTLRGELVRYDRRSDQLRPYLGGISAEFVTYSSDGESMAYVSFPDGVLWKANRDGTGVVQLTEPPFYPKFPRWSPDGMQILFTDSGPNRQDALYVISAHGGSPKRILPEDNGPQSDGNWSPDGKKVLYQPSNFSRSSGGQGKAEFCILDLASHTITTVPGSEGMYWPRWSPDGWSIAGVTRNTYYLRVFDLKSQRWKTLENVWSDSPTWGHDSRYIYFMLWIDNPGVFRIPASGGKAERIIDLKDFRHTGWFEDWMGLDSTDTPLLLRDKGSDDIYALTLERK